MNTAGVETLPGTAWRRLWLRWMELNTVSSYQVPERTRASLDGGYSTRILGGQGH